LPDADELSALKAEFCTSRNLPGGVIDVLKALPKDTSPMHALRTGVSALGCFDSEAETQDDLEAVRKKSIQIIAQVPVIVAAFHRLRQSKEILESDNSLGEAANFIWLITGNKPSEDMERTMDICYILHADHGFNASTFSGRVTIATLSDVYSAVTSAIGTLKGPLHGGANEGVIKMLQEIGDLEKVDAYVDDCLANKRRIMGIGHRVYRVLDPRAPHLKRMAQKLTKELGEPKWIQMSERIAELMLEKKNLNANVDFYSATVYYSLDIPTDLFTPIFAIARTAGWTAHMIEHLDGNRLIRPRAQYAGDEGKPWVPLGER
jgi:citrate synthase